MKKKIHQNPQYTVNNGSHNLLDVNNLQVEFLSHEGLVQAVRSNSFYVKKGETLGIVGESGSGKSVTVRSILRLIRNPGKISGGKIFFNGVDLLSLSETEMNSYRGKEISMIFQEPSAALNPVLTVGEQITEVMRLHRGLTKKEAWLEAAKQLKSVGIPAPEERLRSYPHQLSGGMQQRCMIAIALACSPKLLIADEPTTSLDVTVQSQIVKLLLDLTSEKNVGLLFITHDIALVAQMADRIMVMYGGRIMEEGPAEQIVDNPLHPYTIELLRAMPTINASRGEHLFEIDGDVPNLASPPPGCPFQPRCSKAMTICSKMPRSHQKNADRKVACWLYSE